LPCPGVVPGATAVPRRASGPLAHRPTPGMRFRVPQAGALLAASFRPRRATKHLLFGQGFPTSRPQRTYTSKSKVIPGMPKKDPPDRYSRPTGHSSVSIINCIPFLQVQHDRDHFLERRKKASHQLQHTIKTHHTPPTVSCSLSWPRIEHQSDSGRLAPSTFQTDQLGWRL